MFTRKPSEKTGLDETIDCLHLEMKTVDANSEQYAAMVKQLAKLYKIKTHERPDRVSKDTLAIVTGNLLGIALIVEYERLHVATSKALSFVMKAAR